VDVPAIASSEEKLLQKFQFIRKAPQKQNHIYFCSKHKNKKKLKHNKPYKKKSAKEARKCFIFALTHRYKDTKIQR